MRPPLQVASFALATLLAVASPVCLLPFAQLPAIAQTTEARKAEADRLLQQGIEQFQISQVEAALQSWQQALQMYREIQDRLGEGNALGNLGLVYFSLGNYGKAIDYQEQALTIAREIKNRRGEGNALGNLGLVYFSLGNYGKAVSYHEQSLAIKQKIKDRRGEGNSLGNLGLVYFALGNYGKAISYHEQSLAIAREIKDRLREGGALGNLGNAYDALGNYVRAIEYHEQSLAISRKIKDRLGEGKSLGNLGGAYDALGNYGKAIEYHEQSLAIKREIKDRRGEGSALSGLGAAYDALGNYGKAIEYHEQALAIAREIQDRLGEGKSLGNLGSAYDALGNYDKAIEYQEQSLTIAREIKDRRGEGNALGNLGSAYRSLGNYSKAIEYHKQSLTIVREIKDRRGEETALGSLGLAYGILGNYSKAIEYHEQALAIAREIKDRLGEGISLNNLGLALFKSGNLAAAAKTLMEGIVTWEALRQTGAGNDANKVSIFEQQSRTYRTLQKVLVAQNQPNAALEIAERGRARAFVELLAQQLGSQESGVRSQSGIKLPTLQQIQQIAKAQNATLVQYSILYDEFKIQGKQEPRESELYLWVIQPTGEVTFRKADLTLLWQQQNSSLAQLVEQSREEIGARGRSDIAVALSPESLKQQQEQQARNLKQLHQLLIAPIADFLPKDPNQRVIFMPQGELFLVPFPALLDTNNIALIEQHTILTAPSIQVLELTRQQRQAARSQQSGVSQILIVGDPTMPKVVMQIGDEPEQLSNLPGAKQEALAIAKLFNTQAITGQQATERAITQQMPKARIIHLATHGLLDDIKGLGVPGAIALAPVGNGQPNDGLLTSDEILDMKLNAELVVLSACDTGRGRITGDGVIGLSRSLISAGVPTIVVSLWKVPDDSTALLMLEFYKNLRTTRDKAQALRQAMLTTKQKYSDPLHWAAFTLIGEAE